MKKRTISDLRIQNANIGQYFFSKSTMKFFQSRIESTLYNDKYFITSEQPPYGSRHYTVRLANPDGSIDTVKEFYAIKSKDAAREAIRELLKQDKQ